MLIYDKNKCEEIKLSIYEKKNPTVSNFFKRKFKYDLQFELKINIIVGARGQRWNVRLKFV